MTAPEGRTPSAWGLCPACGSATPDRDGHGRWHDDLEDRLAQLEARLADLLGTTPPDSGGLN